MERVRNLWNPRPAPNVNPSGVIDLTKPAATAKSTRTADACIQTFSPMLEGSTDEGLGSLTNSADHDERRQALVFPEIDDQQEMIIEDPVILIMDSDGITVDDRSTQQEPLPVPACDICGSREPLKFYGANCCGSCETFFRTRVTKKLLITCESGGNCEITKDTRDEGCKHCKLIKCFRKGLIRDAVIHQMPIDSEEDISQIHDGLKARDLGILEFYCRVCTTPETLHPNSWRAFVSMIELFPALQENFKMLVDWMRSFRVFSRFSQIDSVLLLSRGAYKWSLLDAAHRSMDLEQAVVFGIDFVVAANSENTEAVSSLKQRTIKELVEPMRELKMDRIEFALLKCISFFNPFDPRLTAQSEIKLIRSRLLSNLEDYVKSTVATKGRFGQILLLLLTVESLTADISVMITHSSARLDVVMFEIMYELYVGRMYGEHLELFKQMSAAANMPFLPSTAEL